MMDNRPAKKSPLKATQWAKRGFNIPQDTDGAYRVHNRIDKRDVLKREQKDGQI